MASEAPEFVGDRTVKERGGVRLGLGCGRKGLGDTANRLLKEELLGVPFVAQEKQTRLYP